MLILHVNVNDTVNVFYSAYCGGLWIAALRCMVEGARVLDVKEDEDRYNELLTRATEAYQKHLWNDEH